MIWPHGRCAAASSTLRYRLRGGHLRKEMALTLSGFLWVPHQGKPERGGGPAENVFGRTDVLGGASLLCIGCWKRSAARDEWYCSECHRHPERWLNPDEADGFPYVKCWNCGEAYNGGTDDPPTPCPYCGVIYANS